MLPSKAQTDIGSWITSNTKIKGNPFSWEDHEYQKFICDQQAIVISLKKCSQYGLSELAIRRALGFLQINQGTTCIYAFPTASFSQSFSKGRFSPLLRHDLVSKEKITVAGTDSAGVKEFTNSSLIYFIGASTDRQVISVPSDLNVLDEKDFYENQDVPSKLNSRLTHSKFGWEFNLSTPTLPNYSISADYDASKQFVELQQCDKCNHYFQTDYYKHVKLPGFNGDIREFSYLNRKILDKVSLDGAFVQCPKCKRPVNTHVNYRSWECVNPDTKYTSVGIHITPFAGPNIITPSELIFRACKYTSVSDFDNFGLGESFEDSSTGLTAKEIEKCFVGTQDFTPAFTVMGLDLGGLSACTIGKPNGEGGLDIVHAELIPLKSLRKRVKELRIKYKVINTVIDALPYTETVLRIQLEDPNSHAAIFGSSLELYTEKIKEDDEKSALSGLRVVNISRERMLDYTASVVREGQVRYMNCESEQEAVVEHLTDLKRGKAYDKNGELVYKWKKSAVGNDHYFFSLLYCLTAGLMKGFGERFGANGFSVPLIQTIEVEEALNYEDELKL